MSSFLEWKDYKIVYKRYVQFTFCFVYNSGLFFNILEKTQPPKNSLFQKTQGGFGSKLKETVVMVVT